MKFEITVKRSAYEVDDDNCTTVWIVELDHPSSNQIAAGEGSSAGEAFEAALLKLTFDIAEDANDC